MQRNAFGQALSGGYILSYSLDLQRKTFMMQVEVLDSGILAHYEVLFDGVSLFALEDDALSPWERLELTEIDIAHGPEDSSSEEWELRLNLWDLATIFLRCRVIMVDQESLR